MANINAHLMEAACTYGHVAAACGNPVNVVEFLYGLVSWFLVWLVRLVGFGLAG